MTRYFAPGRINLIGEHIDYNGGWVLPAAISLGITAQVSKSNDGNFHFSSATHRQTISFAPAQQFSFNQENAWLNYPLGVYQFLQEKQFTLSPLHIHYTSTLPEASGLSSSACIEVLTMFLLLQENGYTISTQEIALWCQAVENKFIGVNCGIMDQFCIANAPAKSAMLLNCATLEFKQVPINLHTQKVVLLNTKKPRNLIHSKYNERRTECEQALSFINQHKKTPINFLCECKPSDLAYIPQPILKKRAAHAIEEHLRTQQAAAALAQNDIGKVEALINQSHQSLKDNYEVSGNELDTIVQIARTHYGCNAARMTGAGFGGCAIALVEGAHTPHFKTFVEEQYFTATGLQGEVYICDIGEGVKKIS